MTDHMLTESVVSGQRAEIPDEIRRALDINDGDRLLWTLLEEDTVHIRVRPSIERQFEGFDGYSGAVETDVARDHDSFGLG